MKKIIAIAVLTLGFGLAAQAQAPVKKVTANAPAKAVERRIPANISKSASADVEALNKVVNLTDAEKKKLLSVFENKHTYLTEPGVIASEERKSIIYKNTDNSLRATLSADKMAKVDADPTLLKKLTH